MSLLKQESELATTAQCTQPFDRPISEDKHQQTSAGGLIRETTLLYSGRPQIRRDWIRTNDLFRVMDVYALLSITYKDIEKFIRPAKYLITRRSEFVYGLDHGLSPKSLARGQNNSQPARNQHFRMTASDEETVAASSPRSLIAGKSAKMPRSYWDWQEMLGPNRNGFFPYTPKMTLLYGLKEALIMLHEEGLQNVFDRHLRHAEATRVAVRT